MNETAYEIGGSRLHFQGLKIIEEHNRRLALMRKTEKERQITDQTYNMLSCVSLGNRKEAISFVR